MQKHKDWRKGTLHHQPLVLWSLVKCAACDHPYYCSLNYIFSPILIEHWAQQYWTAKLKAAKERESCPAQSSNGTIEDQHQPFMMSKFSFQYTWNSFSRQYVTWKRQDSWTEWKLSSFKTSWPTFFPLERGGPFWNINSLHTQSSRTHFDYWSLKWYIIWCSRQLYIFFSVPFFDRLKKNAIKYLKE